MAKLRKPKDIEDYISKFPADVQAILQNVRETIRHAAPDAKEVISYMMPAFKQHGILRCMESRSGPLGQRVGADGG